MSAESFDLDAFMAEVKEAEQGASRAELDKMIPRIKKLLNLAENASTQDEADAFNAKANRLLSKYGIDALLLADEHPEVPRAVADVWITVAPPYVDERGQLLGVLCFVFGARTVYLSGVSDRRYHVFGTHADLVRIELLFTSLLVQMQRELGRALASTPYRGSERKVFARDFMAGYQFAVQQRLVAAESAARVDAETERGETPGAGTTSVALALIDRTALVDRAVAEAYPKATTKRARKRRSGTGVRAGIEAGERANLGGTDLPAASPSKALHH